MDDALANFAKVLTDYSQFRSQCADATLCRGKVYQAKQDYVKAIEWYRNVLKDYPDKLNRAELSRLRIDILLGKGVTLSAEDQAELATARARYDAAKQEEAAISSARKQAKAKADAGNGETAKAELLTLFSNSAVQNSHGRLESIAGAQLAIGDKANARTTFARLLAVAAGEYSPEGYRLLRLQTHFRLGDYATVISEGQEALAIYTDSAQTCQMKYYMAEASCRAGNVSQCLALYDSVISRYASVTDNEDIRITVAFGLAHSAFHLAASGNKEAAIAKYQRVVNEYADTSMAASAATTLRRLQGEGNH